MTLIQPDRLQHPGMLAEAERRSAQIQLRVADAITAFAGSMNFVYLHAAVFAVWMLVFEKSPWPTLTLIVSLEAIFLSTFVMIGQNRQASFQQAPKPATTDEAVRPLIYLTSSVRAPTVTEVGTVKHGWFQRAFVAWLPVATAPASHCSMRRIPL